MKKLLSGLLLLSAGAFVSGCAPDFKEQQANAVVPLKFVACYSYGCRKRVTYRITPEMN